MAISLVAADAQPIFLLGLTQLFASQPAMSLAAYCVTAQKASQAVREHQPDILLLDLNLPDQNGLRLVHELRNDGVAVKTIVLTAALNDEQTIEALRLGVQGVVLKNMPIPLLLQCIQKVAAGGQWLEKKSIGHAF